MPNEEIKKQNIDKALETGCECFLARGIEKVTMEQISRESGISRASLGRYFLGKSDFVYQSIKWISRKVHYEIEQSGFTKKDNSFTGLQRLRLFMEYTKDLYMRDPRIFILRSEFKVYLYRNIENVTNESNKMIEDMEFRALVRNIFNQGIEDESIQKNLNVDKESKFFCEAYFGFLADSAASGPDDTEYLQDKIERYIDRVIESYGIN